MPSRADRARIAQARTDIYLLGLAKRKGGRLATFDASIPLTAVAGATRAHLEIISA